MSEWQPIESLWEVNEPERYIIFSPQWGVSVGGEQSGEFVIDILNDCREVYATHWMPLPDAPTKDGK